MMAGEDARASCRESEGDVVFGEIAGLPAHVLLIHVVVVLVPLAALAAVLCAVWPALRRRIGVLLPILALVALVAVPLTTQAGEWLERRVTPTTALRAHTRLGDGLLPWVGGLFLVCAAIWLVHRIPTSPLADRSTSTDGSTSTSGTSTGGGTLLRVVLIVLTVVLAAGSVTQTYRIGDSGARAAWQGRFAQQAAPHRHGDD
ncbi:DUF2231 domain-containing protein [Actinocatenispora comari]|uniref:Uncharacterized protein n=1 Tax=Actinocatenispora comari TaxID=2807577 RepID=A0A8J4EK89_9ACTN|nr:DUF2231 domain-containing protein [Actinocatenispora comari]GIL27937.1 hypothetical protein NUM_31910 [Actinocatenispora comari]